MDLRLPSVAAKNYYDSIKYEIEKNYKKIIVILIPILKKSMVFYANLFANEFYIHREWIDGPGYMAISSFQNASFFTAKNTKRGKSLVSPRPVLRFVRGIFMQVGSFQKSVSNLLYASIIYGCITLIRHGLFFYFKRFVFLVPIDARCRPV